MTQTILFNFNEKKSKTKFSILPIFLLLEYLNSVESDEKEYKLFKEYIYWLHTFQHDTDHLKECLIPATISLLLKDTDINYVSKVAEFGNMKYSRCNWKEGNSWSMYLDATLRHLVELVKGNINDEESGYPHIAHAIMNLGILQYYIEHNIGNNDLMLDKPVQMP